MLIQHSPLNSQNKPNFGALKVATAKNFVKGIETQIDIYRLTDKDNRLIDYLQSNIRYRELASDLTKDMQDRWQKIFDYCVEGIQDGYNQNYIAISGNKPCGISTYYCNDTTSYLDGVCKIPDRDNEAIPLTGKTLILNFLKSAQKANSKSVKLDAVKDGPYNVISLYEKLGFKKIFPPEDTGNYQPMEMNKFKLKEQIKTLEKDIKYKEESGSEEVNLLDFLA